MQLFPDEFPFKKPVAPATPPPRLSGSDSRPSLQPITPSAVPLAPAPRFVPPAPCALEAPIPPLPATLPATEVQERRRSPRQSFLARAFLARDQHRNDVVKAPGWRVDLINISMLGARLRSSIALSPGDKVQIKLEAGPLRWASKMRVIHASRLADGNFAIGCEFVANELARPIHRAA